ncbi:MAG: UDP-N-acetylglucosamine 2-epimerase [Candidatus Omnitrophica bacterium]|nr:UDP-N-acetylglucosamine 2-epimerase [Candidatus Omnitrophota bacterium]MDD5352423.1 UDP-N-acetylglucosamine 2-epimerase [Candidatus Omnitrophota bacterium]MDD5550021.1 UDP-N-acetylglucosamine 2-epimerase [Candidatus Omnitrophota bacterium]
MTKKRKICVVTGSRAEYGILFWLLKEICGDGGLKLQLAVTGAHLSVEYGLTYKQIKEDGFNVNAKIPVLSSKYADTELGIAKAISKGVLGFVKAYRKLKPDMVVLLGDRYEIFAAAVAAYVARIPIAHIHGGEITAGCLDEGFRHAITKMSYIHFPSVAKYAQRIIRMGESPDRVFVFGSPAVDGIKKCELLSKHQLEKELNFLLDNPIAVVTYHPETLGNAEPLGQIRNLLEALDILGLRTVFTFPGADIGSSIIYKQILQYAKKNQAKVRIFNSLGQRRYLSLLKCADIMIGNSSSGIHEAPSFKLPVVNIGRRQEARYKAANVIDCVCITESIVKAARIALSKEFKKRLINLKNPFGDGRTSSRIKETLKNIKIGKGLLAKTFYTGK